MICVFSLPDPEWLRLRLRLPVSTCAGKGKGKGSKWQEQACIILLSAGRTFCQIVVRCLRLKGITQDYKRGQLVERERDRERAEGRKRRDRSMTELMGIVLI